MKALCWYGRLTKNSHTLNLMHTPHALVSYAVYIFISSFITFAISVEKKSCGSRHWSMVMVHTPNFRENTKQAILPKIFPTILK